MWASRFDLSCLLVTIQFRQLRGSRFSFNYPATSALYTLSLHDALPISTGGDFFNLHATLRTGHHHRQPNRAIEHHAEIDRKSTRLNSSHITISYAVFCLKKKSHVLRRPLPVRAALKPSAT